MDGLNLDFNEVIRRCMKYIIEGIMVALAAFAIPSKKLVMSEILMIALMAAAIFCILDTYVPSLAMGARSGDGFGIGANLVEFPRAF